MELFYSISGNGQVVRSGSTREDEGATRSAVIGRAQPRQVAVGIGREASWGPLWLTVRHDGACSLTVTPILDGVVRTTLAVTHLFAATGGVPKDEAIKLTITEPVTWAGDAQPFSNQALRGVWFTARAELKATSTAAPGEVLAMGGLEVDARPLAWSRGAVNANP